MSVSAGEGALIREIDEIRQLLQDTRELASKLKAAELAVSTDDTAYRADFQKCRRRLGELLRNPSIDPALQAELDELEASLKHVERIRPMSNPPLILRLSLGCAPFTLPDTRQRLRYKSEYESFKLQATIAHLCLSVVQMLIIKFTAIQSTLLDTITNFLLLYAYSTITLREHILIVNGSNIRTWWIVHHILCVALSGTLLIWPASRAYHASRMLLISFSIYIAAVQALQYRYQMSRLYVLRSLSRVGPMDTTTESAQVHVKNNLAFLMPFLLIGYVSICNFIR